MRFSTSIEYAIHGLVYLAKATPGKPTLVGDVSRATKVGEHYLRKVFQQLARSGIVTSRRGAHGGFSLSRGADRITLRDIVESIDGSLPQYECLRDSRRCAVGVPCPVHRAFEEASQRMAEVLESTSIAELLADIDQHEQAVAWLPV